MMTRPGITGERLVALFLLGTLAFNPPLLSIFDVPQYVLGIPILYVYLFTAWAGLIVLMALTIEGAKNSEDTEEGDALDQRPINEAATEQDL